MLHFLVTIHLLGPRLRNRLEDPSHDRENGSVTMEHVIWAVAVIGIVAIVVTAVTGYVTRQANQLGG
jgi:heme/copper-type cytochrome/quinol oxidase subunit 2